MEQAATEQKKKVLIIDDDESICNALTDTFEREAAIEITVAHDGEAGLASALAGHPDLILLDILMPKMDGITLLKKMREDAWGSTAKIIILTNVDTTNEMLEEIVAAEPSFYLLKSNWKVEDVVVKTKEVLEMR